MRSHARARLRATSLAMATLAWTAGCNALFAVDELSFDDGPGGEGGGTPSCDDGARNGAETDIDCGGDCAPCALGYGCDQASDCATAVCRGHLCSACGDDADCPGDLLCDPAGGACLDGKPNGLSCATDDECFSGHCVAQDGVCCDTACSLTCEACVEGKTGVADGICDFVVADSDPDGECPAQTPASCGSTGAGCSGFRTACRLYDEDVLCQPAACSNGVATEAAFCDGDGSCPTPASDPCGAYACGPDACHSSCSGDAQCAASFWCGAGGVCLAKAPSGAACSANNQCVSGSCTNGFCD